ncbi:MAG: hypothetical protein V4721_06585 [Bacteroidota bacterium]
MKFSCMFFLIALGFGAQAQFPEYYVYLVRNSVSVEKFGEKKIPVKQNQLIYKGEIVSLKENSELTLVDKEGNFIVLNKKGEYKTTDISEMFKVIPNDGLTKKYFKLLFDELLKPDESFSAFKEKNTMGVYRAEGCGNRIFPMNNLKFSTDSILFKWYSTSPMSNYFLTIYDEMGNELVQVNVKDTIKYISSSLLLLVQGNKYFWNIASLDGSCEDEVPISFTILNKDDVQVLIRRLGFRTVSYDLNEGLQQIEMLEKNGLVYEAFDWFDSLLKFNASNRALRKTYVAFLLKYCLDNEAFSVWDKF